jgi:hypothetical protein
MSLPAPVFIGPLIEDATELGTNASYYIATITGIEGIPIVFDAEKASTRIMSLPFPVSRVLDRL